MTSLLGRYVSGREQVAPWANHRDLSVVDASMGIGGERCSGAGPTRFRGALASNAEES